MYCLPVFNNEKTGPGLALKQHIWTYEGQYCRFSYSNLNASIGFIFAAFLAGHTPKMMPVPDENATATATALRFNTAGMPNCCNAKMIHRLITTPMTHPISERTTDSLRN